MHPRGKINVLRQYTYEQMLNGSLPKKLICARLVNIFPTFFGAIAHDRVYKSPQLHLVLNQLNSVLSSRPISLRLILLLLSMPRFSKRVSTTVLRYILVYGNKSWRNACPHIRYLLKDPKIVLNVEQRSNLYFSAADETLASHYTRLELQRYGTRAWSLWVQIDSQIKAVLKINTNRF